MKHLFIVLTLLLSGGALAEERTEQLAIFVGANVGAPEDEVLRYAESDARRVRALLVELGEVRADRAILVTGGGPDDVRRALTESLGRAAELVAAGRRVTLLFYYSGHGDEESLHLPRGALPLAELRRAMREVPASLRVSILDACRSPGRAKGVRRGPAFSTVSEPDAPRGSIELRASSLSEGAQESEELGGSVFTHYLVSALRGAADADGDGRVTLAEAYAYAYRHTMLRTGTQGALQHPSLSVETAGAGEVVLTRSARGAASIEVPGGAERYLVFQRPSAAVLGEVSGETTRRLVLPAGRFLVARRTGNAAGVAEIDLTWGGHRTLSTRDFRPISREELVARGGRIELRRWRADLRAGAELALRAAEEPAASASVALAWVRGPLELEAALGYVGGPLRLPSYDGREHSLVGRLAVGLRLFAGRVTLTPSLGLAARYAFQHLRLRDGSGAVHPPLTEEHAGGALGPDLALRLGVPLPRHVVLSPIVSFAALVRRDEGRDGSALAFHPVVTLAIGVGYAF